MPGQFALQKKIRFQSVEENADKDLQLPGEIRQTLFLIAKEAINNTCKYAAAASCKLVAGVRQNEFYMDITDDGNGFSPKTEEKGNGLKNICDRMKEAGGRASISSAPGSGTKIAVCLPFPFKIPNTWDRKTNGQ